MPPYIQPSVDDDDNTVKLGDHFWSCDLSGMNQLMDHITQTDDALDHLHHIYVKRAELEHAFGQQLESLAGDATASDKTGVTGSIAAVHQELAKAAQSHVDFSKRLQSNVAEDLKRWIQDHKAGLQKIKDTLDVVYEERQDTIGQLYHVRAAYQALDKHSPKRQTLQNEYRLLLNKTDGITKQWNMDWKQACDDIEQMEQDRVEFFTANVWDYANLASARLMVQDEWCESIRTKLETCSFEYEREQCIEKAGVGKSVPTTSDYVTHFFGQQKDQPQPRSIEHINKSLPSKPPPPIQETNSSPQQQDSTVPLTSIKRKPVDQASFKGKMVSAPMALEELLKKFEKKSDGGRRQQQQQRSRDTTSNTSSRQPPSTQSTTNNLPNATMNQLDKEIRTMQQSQPSKSEDNDMPMSPSKPNAHDHTLDLNQQPPPSHETAVPSSPPDQSSNTDRTLSSSSSHKPAATIPPKSPRPQSQQIMSPPQPPNNEPTAAAPTGEGPMHISPAPPPPINTSPNYTYMHQQPPKSSPQHFAPPSPNMAQQYQPGMASSPMFYPSTPAPNFQQAPSPMMPFQQPPSSPMIPTHPISSYSPLPQHQAYQQQHHHHHHHQAPRSPGMMHAAAGPPRSPNLAPTWSTAGSVSRPTSPYSRPASPQRPALLPDGTEILFWCQAMYDYTAQDPMELSFPARGMFAVIYVALDGWWDGVAFDGHHFIGASGSIPSNYMRRL